MHSIRDIRSNTALTNAVSIIVAFVVIVMPAMHFWPLSDSKLWQCAVPFNSLALSLGILIAVFSYLKLTDYQITIPRCLILFVIICFLSIINTPDLKRSLFFTIKIFGSIIGGYSLLYTVLDRPNGLRLCKVAILFATVIAVFSCLFSRIFINENTFGFFINNYKYSTFMSIYGSFTVAILILDKRYLLQIAGVLILTAVAVSAGSISLLFSSTITTFGILTLALFHDEMQERRRQLIYLILICMICLGGTYYLKLKPFLPVYDFSLADGNISPLKQRYIEWQAEINLLMDRIISGTGAGAINTYRSEYYGLLPKMNTLEPFDQNGYLAVAAELGIMGLIVFVWMLLGYFTKAFKSLLKSELVDINLMFACLCSLIGMSLANLFSSILYNGITIAFITIFVAIDILNNKTSSKNI